MRCAKPHKSSECPGKGKDSFKPKCIVTNSGVVLDPQGCRTLYLSERNWEIGGSRPLICCTSRCVLLPCVTYFPGTGQMSSHTPFYK